jgi:hypothetical protein
MMASYWDESEVTEFGFMIVAGWLATVGQWQEFEYGWKLLLAKYDVPYLHMKEYTQSVGPFKKWKAKDGTRKNFMRDVSGIINDTVQHGFCCFVHNGLFDEIGRRYQFREKFNSSYALAGRACASMANEWQNEAPLNRRDMKYVFEDGGPDKGGLLSAMDLAPSLPAPIFEPGKDWKPSTKWPDGRTGLVQLQAADYLAYEIGKFARDRQKPSTQRFRASLGVLPEKKVKRLFFTTSKLETLCRMLNIKRRLN